jgi:ubiquinone/menaquinone biosynthesis C-methylase UbiE
MPPERRIVARCETDEEARGERFKTRPGQRGIHRSCTLNREENTVKSDQNFVPALGRLSDNLASYDRVVGVMSRERGWRSALVNLIAPADEDVIVDVGAGTGTLAVALKQRAPGCRLVAIDPDPEMLELARAKGEALANGIEWRHGMGDQVSEFVADGSANKAVSSLVLHHCDLPVKQSILRAMAKVLRPGGHLIIADYGRQRTPWMRALFLLVQMADGFKTTSQNARGILPELIAGAGFVDVVERSIVPTPTGSISLYTARKP